MKNYKKEFSHRLFGNDKYLETWEEKVIVKKVPVDLVGKEFNFTASQTFNRDSFIEHTMTRESTLVLREYYHPNFARNAMGRCWKAFEYSSKRKEFNEMVELWEDVECTCFVSQIQGSHCERRYFINGVLIWRTT